MFTFHKIVTTHILCDSLYLVTRPIMVKTRGTIILGSGWYLNIFRNTQWIRLRERPNSCRPSLQPAHCYPVTLSVATIEWGGYRDCRLDPCISISDNQLNSKQRRNTFRRLSHVSSTVHPKSPRDRRRSYYHKSGNILCYYYYYFVDLQLDKRTPQKFLAPWSSSSASGTWPPRRWWRSTTHSQPLGTSKTTSEHNIIIMQYRYPLLLMLIILW